MVADGIYYEYYYAVDEFNYKMRVVDIAASSLVLTEAGGSIYDDESNRLNLPLNLDTRSNFLAVCNPSMLS